MTGHERVPSGLVAPLERWLSGVGGPEEVVARARALVTSDAPGAIDAIDSLLSRLPPHVSGHGWDARAAELKRILDAGGSVWGVAAEEGAPYRLTRRVAGPASEVIAEIRSSSERAGAHLDEAWKQLLGTDPDPAAAYAAALSAVEAVARPVVCPDRTRATVGTVRSVLRANPGRWTVEFGEVDLVVSMLTALWENQPRPGDATASSSEARRRADAAVPLALTLVRWFSTGAIRAA
jgi:hypothetical protein